MYQQVGMYISRSTTLKQNALAIILASPYKVVGEGIVSLSRVVMYPYHSCTGINYIKVKSDKRLSFPDIFIVIRGGISSVIIMES